MEMQQMSDKESSNMRYRHARMKVQTAVLMSRGGEAHPTDLVDISATGAMLRRPLGWRGEPGQTWILDMVFGHDLHIHMEAMVARVSARQIGMAYTLIPEDKQAPLWELLGGYADTLEAWTDD
ncbi:pilus assembly protein PilZ [Luteibacter rhizovicinus DSM 16549]|uniref:Pilus assembly protein PilZ n=2 Tax=Luteibacter rhizovicinus TaxID=242606 RepID=A0A1L3EZT8_9GAMM|nr:pilus assembly protein PilZ [Luteibacter rhizovicinus DSM 16549]